MLLTCTHYVETRWLCSEEVKAGAKISLVQVVAVDPGQRGLSEGVQVMAGAPCLLQHCATKQVSLYILTKGQHFCSTQPT